jgi:hypothetical protein
MRTGISFTVSPTVRRRLRAVIADRNAPQNTFGARKSFCFRPMARALTRSCVRPASPKTCVWRWQQRFMDDGFDGLLRDKTRRSRIAPLGAEVAEGIVALTLGDPPGRSHALDRSHGGKRDQRQLVQRIWRAHGLQELAARSLSKLLFRPSLMISSAEQIDDFLGTPHHCYLVEVGGRYGRDGHSRHGQGGQCSGAGHEVTSG